MTKRVSLWPIAQRLAAATRGPWVKWTGHSDVFAGPVDINTRGDIRSFTREVCRCDGDELARFAQGVRAPIHEDDANASLIAHAPSDLDALMCEVDRLRKKVNRLRAKAAGVAKFEEETGELRVEVSRLTRERNVEVIAARRATIAECIALCEFVQARRRAYGCAVRPIAECTAAMRALLDAPTADDGKTTP